METKQTLEEQLMRDLIDKHLNFKSGAESSSIQHYAEYGAVSGSLFLNVKAMLKEYAEFKTHHYQQTIAELEEWKESKIKITLSLFELMHLHPEMKIGDSAIQKAIQFIKERDELKKQNTELSKENKRLEKSIGKYCDYFSLTLDGVEPERAKKDCKL
jgi:hypothetical protein